MGILEACLERYWIEIFGFQPFQDVYEKAAALMHCIIYFHPFVNSNKRTGLVITKIFLEINGFLPIGYYNTFNRKPHGLKLYFSPTP